MRKFKTFDDYVKARQVRAADPPVSRKIRLASTNQQLNLKDGTFYWAYGSNLSEEAMTGEHGRCKGAIKIQRLTLNDGALVFRGVADVVARKGATVHGGLWWINREHEATLDAYEGVRSQFYLKRYLRLRFAGIEKPYPCLYYTMTMRRGVMPPSEGYLQTLVEGYRDFDLPLEALEQALTESWEDKTPTPLLRERHKRRGGRMAQTIVMDPEGLSYGEEK